MYFVEDPINSGEVHYPSSTQQLAERSHYTPPGVCAEMTTKPESSQLLVIPPFSDESLQVSSTFKALTTKHITPGFASPPWTPLL